MKPWGEIIIIMIIMIMITDPQIQDRQPDVVIPPPKKKKRTCRIVEFADPPDQKVK